MFCLFTDLYLGSPQASHILKQDVVYFCLLNKQLKKTIPIRDSYLHRKSRNRVWGQADFGPNPVSSVYYKQTSNLCSLVVSSVK